MKNFYHRCKVKRAQDLILVVLVIEDRSLDSPLVRGFVVNFLQTIF